MELQELINKRLKLIADMRAINDKAENGILTSEREEEYNKMDEEQENLSKIISRNAKLNEIEKGINSSVTKKIPQGASSSSEVSERAKEQEAEVRMEAFRSYIQYGVQGLHNEKFRALNAGLITEGGAFIPPTQFANELIKFVDDATVVRKLATVYTVKGAGSLGFPVWDADPADADWTSELATGSVDSTAATGLRELKPLPIAKVVKLSRKLLRHSVINAETLIRDRLGYKFAITQEKGFLTGNGATAPLGLFTASSQGISTSRDVSQDNTTTAITADGLIECFFNLKSQYQEKATWLFHRTAVKNIRKLKDSTNNYLLVPSNNAGAPDSLLGRPLVQSEYVPNTFTT